MTRAVPRGIDPRTGLAVGLPLWTTDKPHSVGGRNYWTVEADGIRVGTEAGPRRSPGSPLTLAKILRVYGSPLAAAAAAHGIPRQLLAAVVATESGGNEAAERYEPRLYDYSTGLCQTLTATAAGVFALAARRMGWTFAPPKDQQAWRILLRRPEVSLALGAALLRANDQQFACQGDPILLYAAYNAGSPRSTTGNDWGLVHYGSALDHFAAWYGDACAVVPPPSGPGA